MVEMSLLSPISSVHLSVGVEGAKRGMDLCPLGGACRPLRADSVQEAFFTKRGPGVLASSVVLFFFRDHLHSPYRLSCDSFNITKHMFMIQSGHIPLTIHNFSVSFVQKTKNVHRVLPSPPPF